MRMRTRKNILVLALLSLSLGGCSAISGLEKDLNVVAMLNDEIFFSATTNIFTNVILPTVAAANVPSGMLFLGWSLPGWTFGVDSNSDLYSAQSLVRYNDVKAFATGDTVSFSAVIIDKEDLPKAYLTLGWYAKESTSGLNDVIMANFTAALATFLQQNGASEKEWASVVIRGYQGQVADIGAAINADGDCDILLGVGGNIETTGLVACLEKIGGIMMGGKSRYVARLTDSAVAKAVYVWLQTPAAQATLASV